MNDPIPVRILKLLKSRKGKLVTYEEIFQQVWGEPYLDDVCSNTLYANVSYARRFLDEGSTICNIRRCYVYLEDDVAHCTNSEVLPLLA